MLSARVRTRPSSGPSRWRDSRPRSPSSVFELFESPPRPTQKADAVVPMVLELQFALGWAQLPLTVENVVPVTA